MWYRFHHSRIYNWWAIKDSNLLVKWHQIYSLAQLTTSADDPYKAAAYGALRPIYLNGIWNKKNKKIVLLVGREGIEPSHHFWYRILSPVRLPVPPSAQLRVRPNITPTGRQLPFYCQASLNHYFLRDSQPITRICGARGRSRTFIHLLLRQVALPVCLLVHLKQEFLSSYNSRKKLLAAREC